MTALVDTSLDQLADHGTVDLIETLAFPLPFTVISEMLDTPPTDHLCLRELMRGFPGFVSVRQEPSRGAATTFSSAVKVAASPGPARFPAAPDKPWPARRNR